MKKLVALAIVLVPTIFITPALASPVFTYDWHQLSASPTISSSYGVLSVFRSAWHGNTLTYRRTVLSLCEGVDPNSPIARVLFGVNGPASPVRLYDTACPYRLAVNITRAGIGGLSGRMYFQTYESNVGLGSISATDPRLGVPIWVIGAFSSDNGATECTSTDPEYICSGAIGYWQLAQINVLAPDMLPAFVGFAFMMLVMADRRAPIGLIGQAKRGLTGRCRLARRQVRTKFTDRVKEKRLASRARIWV